MNAKEREGLDYLWTFSATKQKYTKINHIFPSEKSVTHTKKTQTKMSRDTLVIRANKGVCVSSRKSRDLCCGINMSSPASVARNNVEDLWLL